MSKLYQEYASEVRVIIETPDQKGDYLFSYGLSFDKVDIMVKNNRITSQTFLNNREFVDEETGNLFVCYFAHHGNEVIRNCRRKEHLEKIFFMEMSKEFDYGKLSGKKFYFLTPQVFRKPKEEIFQFIYMELIHKDLTELKQKVHELTLLNESEENKKERFGEMVPLHDSSSEEFLDTKTIKGRNILIDLMGLWVGSVRSSTVAGSFRSWKVDFRPTSPCEVSGISDLSKECRNYMSFFVILYKGEYCMAFRNGGGFRNQDRIAYEVIEEEKLEKDVHYYKFVDFQARERRVSTHLTFFAPDENGKFTHMNIQVFTNVYNTLTVPKEHMKWETKLIDGTTGDEAKRYFRCPHRIPKNIIRDFSNVFEKDSEAVFYSMREDCLKDQEYLGSIEINPILSNKYESVFKTQTSGATKILILLTVKSLFTKLYQYQKENEKYSSRYLLYPFEDLGCTINLVHPGKYYLYVFVDLNGDGTKYNFMNSDSFGNRNVVTVKPSECTKVDVSVDHYIK